MLVGSRDTYPHQHPRIGRAKGWKATPIITMTVDAGDIVKDRSQPPKMGRRSRYKDLVKSSIPDIMHHLLPGA